MRSLTVGMWFAGLLGDGKGWVYLAIAAATLIFAFEVVCIGVLIGRMVQAKKRRDGENGDGNNDHRAFAVLFAGEAMLGAFSAESVLRILLILAVAGAAVLAILLIAARIAGFDFVSADLHREEEERLKREAEERARREKEEAERAAAERAAERAAEAERNERVRAEATEEARRQFEEEERRREEERARAEAEREAAMAEEPEVSADEPEPGKPEPEEPAAPAGGMTAVGGQPAAAPSRTPERQGKFVHMEKTVTETVRETQTTTPVQPAPAPAQSGPTESEKLLKTLVEALIGQKQAEAAAEKNAERAAATPAEPAETGEQPDGSVPVSAIVPTPAEDDEDESPEEAARNDREDDEDFVDDADDSDRFSGNERIIGYNEETGCYIVAHYRKSFEGRLIQSRPHIKHFYSELKNALLSYKGTRSRVSWNADSFTNGKTPIAKINIRSNNLELYLALDPASLEDTIYHGRDVSHQKRYADTPFKYKVRSDRKFGWALELVQRVCEEQGLSPIDIEKIDYEEAYPFEETEDLVRRGVIREYIREEKPATSFELAEDHISQTPDVDESVVPPSANVFWELDNDAPRTEPAEPEEPEEPEVPEAPEVPEPAEVPEPTPEPEPAPAPEPVQQPQVTQTVTKETVRTTQIRYTEQVFGDDVPTATPPVTYAEFVADDPMMGTAAQEPAESAESAEPEEPAETAETTEPQEPAEFAEEPETEAAWSAQDPADVDGPEPDEPEAETEDTESAGGGLMAEFDNTAREDDLDWGVPTGIENDFLSELPEEEPEPELPAADEPETAEAEETAEVLPEDEADEPEMTEETAEPETYDSLYEEEPEPEAGQYDAQYADEEQYADDEQYDENGQYADDGQYDEQYGENGQYADDGQYDEQYDENAQYADDGQYDKQYGENGQYADDGQYEEQYDENAQYADDGQYEEQYDENAQYADDGQYDEQYDENAQYADDGQYEEQYDGQYDDNGQYVDDGMYDDTDDRMSAVQVDPSVALVDLCRVEAFYDPNEVVNLETLKERGIVMDSARTLKVHASGELHIPLTVEAQNFSLEALTAIAGAGGDSVKVKEG